MRLLTILALAGSLLLGAARAASEPELQRAADELIATTQIPAVVTLVEQDGRRVVVASGQAEVGGRLARPEDRFWIGSVTKTFVATVVMQLVAQHRLRLDDTVSRFLPRRLQAGRRSGSGTCSTTRAGCRTTCSTIRGAARSIGTRTP